MRQEISIYTLIMTIVAVSLYYILNALNLLVNTTIVVIYWSHITVGSLSIGITILYFIRYQQSQVKALIYMFLSKLSFLILYVVQAVSIAMLNAPYGTISAAKTLYYIGILLGGTGPVLFVIFLSRYVYEQVQIKELVLPLVYLGMLLTYIVTDQLFGTEARGTYVFFAYKPSVIFLNSVGLLMYVYVGWYTIYRIRQTRSRLRDPSLRFQQQLFMVGSALIYIGAPFVFAAVSAFDNPTIQFYWINIVAPTFIIGGISLTAIPYVISTKAAFLQPQPLHQLIVIKKGGLPILSYNFDSPMAKNLKVNDVLFSSAVSAVSSLMGEAIDAPLKAIQFQNRIALTQFDDDLAYIVIVDFVTDVISRGLKQFASRFGWYYSQHYGTDSDASDLETEPEVVDMVLSHFGY